LGFGIWDFGFNGKAHGAWGIGHSVKKRARTYTLKFVATKKAPPKFQQGFHYENQNSHIPDRFTMAFFPLIFLPSHFLIFYFYLLTFLSSFF
jgi:hypothetical protein